MTGRQKERQIVRAIWAGVLVLMLTAVAGVASQGCVLFTKAPTNQTQQDKLIAISRMVDAADKVVTSARALQDLEVGLFRDGTLKGQTAHEDRQRAFLAFFTAADKALATANDLSAPDVARRQAIQIIANAATDLAGSLASDHPAIKAAVLGLSAAATALSLYS